MVGHQVLVLGIGVRVPTPQLAKVITPMRMHWGFSFALRKGSSKDGGAKPHASCVAESGSQKFYLVKLSVTESLLPSNLKIGYSEQRCYRQ